MSPPSDPDQPEPESPDAAPATRPLGELVTLVGGEILAADQEAAGTLPIQGVGDLRLAGPGQIGFVRKASYAAEARGCRASALLVPEPLDLGEGGPLQVQVRRVDAAFARIAQAFHPLPRAVTTSIHPTASVDPSAKLQDPVVIGANATIGAGVSIGAGTVIMAGCCVMEGTSLGRDCLLYPNVTVYQRCVLGRGVILHAGVVVGADGFGYAPDDDGYVRIPQGGIVELSEDVEVGANSVIDRGTLGVTRVGVGTKIDNLCHVGHNCSIGARVVLAAGCFIAGSTTVGNDCQIGGHVIFGGHLKVTDQVRIGGNSAVVHDVPESGNYMGYPLVPQRTWWRWLQRQRKKLLNR